MDYTILIVIRILTALYEITFSRDINRDIQQLVHDGIFRMVGWIMSNILTYAWLMFMMNTICNIFKLQCVHRSTTDLN